MNNLEVKMTTKEIKELVRIFKSVEKGLYTTEAELTELAMVTIASIRES